METPNKDTQNSPLSAQPSTEEINEKIETVVPDGEKEVLPVDDKEEKTPAKETDHSDSDLDKKQDESSAETDDSPSDDIETVSP